MIETTVNDELAVGMFDLLTQPEILTHGSAETLSAGTVLGRVTASGKLAAYASGGADGSQNPVAILLNDAVFTAAGDKEIDALIAGQVRLSKLVEHGVGALTNKAKLDALRAMGLIAIRTTQLAK